MEGCCQYYPRAGIGGISKSEAEWNFNTFLFRRLEVLLDRSWEKESITWTGLTWWDPLPCGQDFVVQVHLSSALVSFNLYFSPGYKISSTAPPFSCSLDSLQPSHSKAVLVAFGALPFALASPEPLHLLFIGRSLHPCQPFSRVLPVCLLNISRLCFPPNPFKFTPTLLSAMCSSCWLSNASG